MMPLSAIDAISPSWERAKKLLFEPFSMKRFVKLGLMAFLGIIGGAFLVNIGQLAGLGVAFEIFGKATSMPIFAGLLAGIVVLAILGIGALYLGSRARLADLWMIATGDTSVGRAWSRSGRATWPFSLAFLIWVAIMTAGVFAIVVVFFGSFISSMRSGSHPNPDAMFLMVMVLWVAMFPVMMVATAVQIFIRDFMAVPLLFDDASVGMAWQTSKEIVRQSPGQCALFLLMYFVIGMVISLAVQIGLFVVLVASAIPGGVIGFGIYQLSKNMGHTGQILLIAPAAAVGAAWILFVMFVLWGAGQLVLQCYSAYFVGSRNRVLGDMLQPPTDASPA